MFDELLVRVGPRITKKYSFCRNPPNSHCLILPDLGLLVHPSTVRFLDVPENGIFAKKIAHQVLLCDIQIKLIFVTLILAMVGCAREEATAIDATEDACEAFKPASTPSQREVEGVGDGRSSLRPRLPVYVFIGFFDSFLWHYDF